MTIWTAMTKGHEAAVLCEILLCLGVYRKGKNTSFLSTNSVWDRSQTCTSITSTLYLRGEHVTFYRGAKEQVISMNTLQETAAGSSSESPSLGDRLQVMRLREQDFIGRKGKLRTTGGIFSDGEVRTRDRILFLSPKISL